MKLWHLAVLGPAAAFAVLTMLAAPPVGDGFLLSTLAGVAGLMALCTWMTCLAYAEFRRPLLLLGPPLIAGLALWSSTAQVPTRAAFLLSEPALTAYADALPEKESWTFEERRAGLFTITQARRRQGVVQLATGDGGLLVSCGLARAPADRLADIEASEIEHLTGDWYTTCLDFD
ncbi:hypothetical protein [Nonomuraea roseola]|uniref:Uncharacterized protein n=1 Tax=Nonomuraea roseola TaxID=46179 RepID=A0ABV5PXW4_9ACTN